MRCIFFHDLNTGRCMAYGANDFEQNSSPYEIFDPFPSIKGEDHFTISVRVLDYSKHIYRINFTNSVGQESYIDIKNDNTTCRRVWFDNGYGKKVYINLGCADFFPEIGDQLFATRAADRVRFLESLNAEKDNSNDNENSAKSVNAKKGNKENDEEIEKQN